MKMQELKDKTEQELHTLLGEKRDALRILRFKVSLKQLTHVREIRFTRALLARILLELRLRRTHHKKSTSV